VEAHVIWKVAILVWIVLGTILAIGALMVVVRVPGFVAQSMTFIPYAVVAGFLVAIPFSIWAAAKMMAGSRPRQ
jgi:hypothetical protein